MRRYSRRCGYAGSLQDYGSHPVFLVSVALSIAIVFGLYLEKRGLKIQLFFG